MPVLLGAGMFLGAALALGAGMVIVIILPVAIVLVGAFCGLMLRLWQATEPGRTYDMHFNGSKTADVRKDNDQLAQLIVHVRAKKPVITSHHAFRLVTRHLSPRLNRVWRWQTAPMDTAAICQLYDAEMEDHNRKAREQGNPWGGRPLRFEAKDKFDGSWEAEYRLAVAAIETAFHYRVIVKMASPEIWRGFLEFTAPGKNGRLSTTHRGVTLWP